MNILFLSLLDFESIEERNIYTDLLRKFYNEGHNVYVISPVERKKKQETRLLEQGDRSRILKLKIGNIQKTNIIEKGISTVTIEGKFIKAIKRYFSDVKFDLVLYTTPPITLQKAVNYVKKRDGATTYLMLKDIFPQNAVDMGMLTRTGWKGMIYRYFRNKEKRLYRDSDFIGCMSQANVDYVKAHNPDVDEKKIEICPNCMEPTNLILSKEERTRIRELNGIPNDSVVFVYGGNLGKPQGIPFMLKCLEQAAEIEDIYFLIVGSGTEYEQIKKWLDQQKLANVKLFQYLPKEKYEQLVRACDVGLIFLDYRFTIPNFPSRLLSYMDAGLPVLAATDENTDIGKVIENGKMGIWCNSNDVDGFLDGVKRLRDSVVRTEMGQASTVMLNQRYTADVVCSNLLTRISR